jgi:biopolymer transport protein ExbB
MENRARKEIGKLWQNIAYLGDIATIAPLLGLLGTVIGMIQAFSVISFAGSSLKPIMLVGGISKALVCTAAGLVIAIPCMSCYSFFRGKVQSISDQVEAYASDIMRLIEEPNTSKKNEV